MSLIFLSAWCLHGVPYIHESWYRQQRPQRGLQDKNVYLQSEYMLIFFKRVFDKSSFVEAFLCVGVFASVLLFPTHENKPQTFKYPEKSFFKERSKVFTKCLRKLHGCFSCELMSMESWLKQSRWLLHWFDHLQPTRRGVDLFGEGGGGRIHRCPLISPRQTQITFQNFLFAYLVLIRFIQ